MTHNSEFTLDELCDFKKGGIGIKKAVPGKYPLIVLAEERMSHKEYQFDCSAVLVPLVSSTGHGHASINRIHFQEGKFALGSILVALIPKDNKFLHPYFLYIYLSYFKDSLLVPLMRGAANVSLSIKNIKKVKIIVPSYERQLEIIDIEKNIKKINSSLSKNFSCQNTFLAELKRSVLQDAIQGKLTEDWRKKNPDAEPASELLKKIKAEKERLIKEKKIRKERPLPPIAKEETLFDLPKNWEWCCLGAVGEVYRGKSPKYKKNNNSIILNQKCVRWGNIDKSFAKEVDFEWLNGIKEDVFTTTDDILVNSTGEGTIGRSAVVDKNSESLLYDSHVLLLRKLVSDLEGKYIVMVINSNFGQSQIEEVKGAKSTKQTELGVNKLKNILLPLPPVKEQKEIVKKVDGLMKKIGILKEEIKQNKIAADLLMQSVLKEAFDK